MQAFLLSLLVLTWRRTRTLDIDQLRDYPEDQYHEQPQEHGVLAQREVTT